MTLIKLISKKKKNGNPSPIRMDQHKIKFRCINKQTSWRRRGAAPTWRQPSSRSSGDVTAASSRKTESIEFREFPWAPD